MKKIEAIIKPFKLQEVQEALADLGMEGATACTVRGFGRQKCHTETYRGRPYTVDFYTRVKLEIVVCETLAAAAVAAVVQAARTGRFGDGKVFVTTVEEALLQTA